MDPLLRFKRPLSRASLAKTLAGEMPPTEAVGSDAELRLVDSALSDLDPDARGSDLDKALVEPIHLALRGMSRRQGADMRMWHWMASVRFRDFVWRRWGGTEGSVLSDSIAPRFLGGPSLGGVSRNTFARLYWLAEHLGGDYAEARAVLGRQDMFQAIFERTFGLYPPAVQACLRKFRGRSEDDVRSATKWLNYVASTTVLEALDASEIESILTESIG
jgi:hypothetical protein